MTQIYFFKSLNIRGCPSLNNSLNQRCQECCMPQWYRGGFHKDHLKGYFGLNTVKVVFISEFFLYLLRNVLGNLFSIEYFTYYLFHILILYYILLILKCFNQLPLTARLSNFKCMYIGEELKIFI